MKTARVLIGASVLVLMTVSGCDCDDPQVAGGPCEANEDCQSNVCTNGVCVDPNATPDAGEPAPVCIENSKPCTPGADQTPCCGGALCLDHGTGTTTTCVENALCGKEGVDCTTPMDCCSVQCTNGKCGGTACKQLSAACGAASECCSGTCTNGSCATITGALCKTLGEACAAGTDCCSKNCLGGKCTGVSWCSAAGDICYADLDCCNGNCSETAGGPGVCAASVNVPGASQCTVGGEPCDGSEGCCSHLCTDLGAGKAVCVLGSGCRERGEICGKTEDCCGHLTSTVVCAKDNTNPSNLGRCANSTACQPVGNCCGAFGDNCRQSCCDGQKEVCQLDLSGLSRCFGGGSTTCPAGWDGLDPLCCIPDGQECQFRDQCCNLSPCIQVNGTYQCSRPQCVLPGAACTPGGTGADACCDGLNCLSSGELGGTVCRAGDPVIPPIGSADGGIPAGGDGGTGPQCAANGVACTAGAECCSGTCIGGVCALCKAIGTNCGGNAECCSGVCEAGVCREPNTCVNTGGICSGTSECCYGLACVIPAGSANGTCEPGASCGASGQSCSTTAACCSGLRCSNVATSADCAAGDARCTCVVILN